MLQSEAYPALTQPSRPMAINLAHRRDLDERVERLAARLGLTGRGRKVGVIERALTTLEEQVERDHPDRGTIIAALDRYIRHRLLDGVIGSWPATVFMAIRRCRWLCKKCSMTSADSRSDRGRHVGRAGR